MMDNAVIEAPSQLSAEVAERVLATGDLKELSARQRVEYVVRFCDSLGLNPLTRPVRFLTLNGQLQLYFTRDGTDQLRRIHNISLAVVEQRTDAGVFQVRVKASMPSGRHDEDIGAVTLPQSGESRANALMKCTTKAKRRVTLSICGLGFLSEDELDTMPGARTFAVDEDVPVESTLEKKPPYVPPEGTYRAPTRPPVPDPQRPKEAWQAWLLKLRLALSGKDQAEIAEICGRQTVVDALEHGPEWVQRDTRAIMAEAYEAATARADDKAEADIPFPDDLAIKGEDKAAAG